MNADELERADMQRYEAMKAADVEALSRLLSDDLCYVHSSGVVDTKASYLKNTEAHVAQYIRISPSKVKAKIFGECGVMNGIVEMDINLHGENKTYRNIFTSVWVNNSGQLQMVFWQSTMMPS